MKYLKSLQKIRIKVFGAGWWFYMILMFLTLGLVTYAGKDLPFERKRLYLLGISITEYLILRLYKFALKDIRDDSNYYNELPCYLCNQSTILCIIGCQTLNRIFMSYCVSVGTLGALLALTMPDRYNRDQILFSKQAFGFYGYHGLLVVTCLAFYTLGLYDPRPIDAIWPMLMTFVLACIAHLINMFLRKTGLNPISNYVFTYDPDNAIFGMLYKWWPVPLFYLIPVLPVFGLISLIAFSVM